VQTLLFGFALAFGLALAFALGFGALKLLFTALAPMKPQDTIDGLSSRKNAGLYVDAKKVA
jgi:hypothetical protein